MLDCQPLPAVQYNRFAAIQFAGYGCILVILIGLLYIVIICRLYTLCDLIILLLLILLWVESQSIWRSGWGWWRQGLDGLERIGFRLQHIIALITERIIAIKFLTDFSQGMRLAKFLLFFVVDH